MASSTEQPPKKANRAGFRLSASRLSAVQALYEIEIAGANAQDVLNSFKEKRWRDVTLSDPDLRPSDADKAKLANPDPAYLAKLVEGATRERTDLVSRLDEVLTGDWTSKRLDALMRMLLLSAAFEFLHQTEVPKKVVISEYTDLAHAFFEDNEAAFVVGVISALAAKLRPDN